MLVRFEPGVNFSLGVLIAQWIEREPPKLEIWVRLPMGTKHVYPGVG